MFGERHDVGHAGAGDGRPLLADDFVEHEETPGLAPTKDGVLAFFRMYRAAFPDLRMDPEDIVADGDKAVARVQGNRNSSGRVHGDAGNRPELRCAAD